MKKINLRNIFLVAAMVCIAASSVLDIVSLPAEAQQKTTTTRKRKAKTTNTKGKTTNASNKGKTTSASNKGKTTTNKGKTTTQKEKAASAKPETSSDVKRRQEATQKEIKQTEAQIRENEKSVKTGLSELGKIEGDIATSKNKIAATTKQITTLNGQISGLEKSISTNEAELAKMREEYLKALKKMRLLRKKNSGLAFVFASENFNQALRRMRYLKQFSEWKDRQTSAIESKNTQLMAEKESLAKAKGEHDAALKRQQAEQAALNSQYAKQDALVAGLKKNGDALKSHLSKKQAEANELRNRIAALIAEEERKAAEERARQEAARKAEEERLARQEAERVAAEKAAEEARLLAENTKSDKQAEKDAKKLDEAKKKAEKEAQKKAEEEKKKSEKERKRKQKTDNRKEPEKKVPQEYADARKRTPRGDASVSKSVASVGSGNFGSMKGSLPKPVSGAFKVTSRFGRQSLPDLPDVMYDNPGIDAEVNAGASALAVYGGKVSGVYMLPGYNTVVIVNHGNYYTVYGNIASAAVKVGDSVNAGQGLGRLAPDEDDNSHSSIHFEVWRNREKLNPLDWIKQL